MNFTNHFVAMRTRLASLKLLESHKMIRYLVSKFLERNLKNGIFFDNHHIDLHPHDIGVGLELLATKNYEAISMKMCKKILKPGMTFVDVGAHIGLYTLMAASCVGPKGRVIAYEPEEKNFHLLRENVNNNKYSNVRIMNAAVSDKTGRANLYRSEINPSDHRLLIDGKNRTISIVDCVKLDDALTEEKCIDFIKIDVQGLEGPVLRGMAKTLERCPDMFILFELSPSLLHQFGEDALLLLQQLERQGMQLFLIDEIHGSVMKMGAQDIIMHCPFESYVNILCHRNEIESLRVFNMQ